MILKWMIGGFGGACCVKKRGTLREIRAICGLIWRKAKMSSTLRLIIPLKINANLPGRNP
jgi:hypothetical protein